MDKYKRIEFHVHSIASKDSMLTRYFLLFTCKFRKIDCIAITDHNEIWFAQKYKDFFEKHKLKIIIGEEIFTNKGEIIGLFLNERISPNLSPLETVKQIKKQNGLVYIPHPYDEKRKKTVLNRDSLEKIKSYVDFIEIHNGRNIDKSFSEMQLKIANETNLTKIVGSDAHTFYEIGRNYCEVNSICKDTLVEEIKKASFQKKACIKFAHINTKFVKIFKMILKGEFDGIFKIINKKLRRGK